MLSHFNQFTGKRRDTPENYSFDPFIPMILQKAIKYLCFQSSELNKYSKINKLKMKYICT